MSWYPHAQSLSFAATGSQRLAQGRLLLMGWHFLETSGSAAATLELYDGMDTTSQLVLVVSLSASQSTRDWLAGDGILCGEGVYLNVISGTVRGGVWVRMRRQDGENR